MQGMEQEMPISGESGRELSMSGDSEMLSVACSDAVIAPCASVPVCVKTSRAIIPHFYSVIIGIK